MAAKKYNGPEETVAYVARGAEIKSRVEFYLAQDGDLVQLKARTPDGIEWNVIYIADGVAYRDHCLPEDYFSVDGEGRIEVRD